MSIIELVDNSDPCSTLFLIVLLVIVGGVMVGANGQLQLWGKRTAAAFFLLYVVQAFVRLQPQLAEEWIGIIVRGIMVAGVALGVSWILLAVGELLTRRTRR